MDIIIIQSEGELYKKNQTKKMDGQGYLEGSLISTILQRNHSTLF
jgi:hypothetical protein